jgi:hypothetical protein
MAMEEYPYARINFKENLDMPLPPGSTYGDIGMSKFLNISFFCIFIIKKKYGMMSGID